MRSNGSSTRSCAYNPPNSRLIASADRQGPDPASIRTHGYMLGIESVLPICCRQVQYHPGVIAGCVHATFTLN